MDGNVHFHLYEICGLVYHLGHSPNTGHYRAVLRSNDRWLDYDDGTLPVPLQDLTDTICNNVVMIWLIPARDTPARHMMERRAAAIRAGTPDSTEAIDDTEAIADDASMHTPRH